VAQLKVVSRDKYSRDITLSTTEGHEVDLDFEGNALATSSRQVTLKVIPRHTRRGRAS
jgi:hypothetical protein